MKTLKKALLVLCIIIIAVGMFIWGRIGLNYEEGYSEQILLSTINSYTLFLIISTLIILVYWSIKYHKQGVIKVLLTAILGIAGAIALSFAAIAISRMHVSRYAISILLVGYVSSIIAITAYFEENN